MSLTTLNKDIKLVKNQYDTYDYSFIKNDLEAVDGLESYRTGIMIAILTGYQELNKTGNPTYTDFGNKSYTTLKRNQSRDVEFELESYITETVGKMRRTKSVNSVTVVSNENNGYNVTVNATSITDDDVVVVTSVNDSISKLNTVLYAKTGLAYCNTNIPLKVDITLQTYEDNTLLKDIVYIYVNNIYIQTLNIKETGTTFKYTPLQSKEDNILKIVYNGNDNYNSSEYILHFISEV